MDTPPPIPSDVPPPLPQSENAASQPESPPIGAAIPYGTLCRGCGYELSGLEVGSVCPECSKPAAESIQSDLISFSSPEYLQSLHRGSVAILASILFYVLGMVASGIAGFAAAFSGGFPGAGGGAARTGSAVAMQTTVAAFSVGVNVIYSLVSVVGWYWFSERDPGVGVLDKADKHRRLLRAMTIANGVCGIVNAVFSLLGLSWGQSMVTAGGAAPQFSTAAIIMIGLSMLIGLGVFVLWVIQFFASLNYMAWLARRIPDEKMRKDALQYRWVLPLIFVLGYICIGLGPLVALVLYYNLINKIRVAVRSTRMAQGYGTKLFDRGVPMGV